MEVTFFFLTVLFVSYIASGAAENTSGFDHFWMVQSWPPVYCQQIRCERKPSDFVLHGLWPVNSTGHTLKNSTKKTPNFREMIRNVSFAGEMDNSWPSLGSKEGQGASKHVGFWEHEWEEHGSGQPYREEYYLQAVIRLTRKVNLLRILRSQKIFPGAQSYRKTDFIYAIKDIYGYPILKCYKDYLLSEVIICVDGQARNFISCSQKERRSTNCHQNSINFPPFSR